MNNLPPYNPLVSNWRLDESVVYLNHGSFGATPAIVQDRQRLLQKEMEAEAVDFFVDKLPTYSNESKQALANFVGTDTNNIVFTPNTTTGVNTIFNSLAAQPGDEWLINNHNYGACIHMAKHYANKYGCSINMAVIPFPVQSAQEIINAIAASITPKTTVALIDYITSATAVVFPVKEIIELLHSKGIQVILDAAHAPGMVDFTIDALQPDYFIANCHKWICSPKGSAFIYVAPQHQAQIAPLVISHYNDTAEGTAAHWSNQFLFDGTHDYSAYICVKDAIEVLPKIALATWDEIKKQNHELCWAGATKIAEALNTTIATPKELTGTICNIALPKEGSLLQHKFMGKAALKETLFQKYRIEVPIMLFPSPTQYVRVSAQLYNSIEQYEYLAACLVEELVNH